MCFTIGWDVDYEKNDSFMLFDSNIEYNHWLYMWYNDIVNHKFMFDILYSKQIFQRHLKSDLL